MSDGFSLLLVLVIVYLSDCLIFLHRQAVALVRPWRAWRIRFAGWSFGNAKGALLGLQPLPPLGMLHETGPWPLSLAEEGVCAFTSASYPGSDRPPQTGRTFLYGDIKDVKTSGQDIQINGTLFAKTASAPLAAQLAALVEAAASAPRERRMKIVGDSMDASLDVESARTTSSGLAARSRGLRIACNVLWTYIYMVCPLATFFFGLGWLIIPLAVAGLLIHIPVVVWFVRLHRRLHPADGGTRFELAFRMSLCPPMAIRAVDGITRHGLTLFHPAAAAVALCPAPVAAPFAAGIVRDLRYPAPIPLEGPVAQIESSFRALLRERIQAMMRKNAIGEQNVPAPDHVSPESRTFCPRCLNVYAIESGACHDCFDTKLDPLPSGQAARKGKT
jgi:hypothetical protein